MTHIVMILGNHARGFLRRMSRPIVLAAFATLLGGGATQLHAQGMFGFGLIVGEPTGIAWKYKLNHRNAIDGAIGFSPNDRFRIHVDYLWHSYPFQEEHLAIHYGLGAAFGFGRTDYVIQHGNSYFLQEGDFGFGARAVVGLTYSIPRSPVDTFFEMAPIIVAAPGPGFGLDLGLGVRVYP